MKTVKVVLTAHQIIAVRALVRITFLGAVAEQVLVAKAGEALLAARNTVRAVDNFHGVDGALATCLHAGQKAGTPMIPLSLPEDVHDLLSKIVASEYGERQYLLLGISGEDATDFEALIKREIEGLRISFQNKALEARAVSAATGFAYPMGQPDLKQ